MESKSSEQLTGSENVLAIERNFSDYNPVKDTKGISPSTLANKN